MDARPDYCRLGGLYWEQRSRGQLSWPECTRLSAAILRELVGGLLGVVRLRLGWTDPKAAGIDVSGFSAPGTRLACEAAKAAKAELPQEVFNHSLRAWLFGLALAGLDESCYIDPSAFYCAALFHDYGLVYPSPEADFTMRSADRAVVCAKAAGLDSAKIAEIADAICVHATPGISPGRDGALVCYLQWGSMLDVVGLRLWRVTGPNRGRILQRYPRSTEFRDDFIGCFKAEAKAFPQGRFALLVRWGITFVIRYAPLAG